MTCLSTRRILVPDVPERGEKIMSNLVPSAGSSLDGLSDALSAGDQVYSLVASSRSGLFTRHTTRLPCWARWWAEGYQAE